MTVPDTASPCPICGAPPASRFRPFCSRRCADVDLGRWLTGGYAIPVDPDDEAPDTAREAPGQDRERLL